MTQPSPVPAVGSARSKHLVSPMFMSVDQRQRGLDGPDRSRMDEAARQASAMYPAAVGDLGQGWNG
jgi:hypothetical protein